MDIQFSLMRLNIAFDDWTAVKAHIKRVRLRLTCAANVPS